MSGNPSASWICTETPFFTASPTSEFDHLADRLVDIRAIIPRRRFLDVSSNPGDDLSMLFMTLSSAWRTPDLADFWIRTAGQKPRGCAPRRPAGSLHVRSSGAQVRITNGKLGVVDVPFVEAKEVIGG
jgi:hypothetical protein